MGKEIEKIWPIVQWQAQDDRCSTSDKCSHKLDYDKNTCYDPISHETHPCTKEECPFYKQYEKI